MNKKVVMFASVILFLGLLSINSLAANSYSPSQFEFDERPSESFVWDLDVNVSEIIVSVPSKISVENVNANNGKIELKAKSGIGNGIYTVSALTIEGQSVKGSYVVPIMIGMATEGQIDNLNEDIEDVEDKVDDVNNNLKGKINDLKDRVEETEDYIENLQDRLSNVKSSGSEREDEIKSLDKSLDSLTAKLENLKGDLSEAETELNEVQTTTSTGMVFTSASLGIGIFILVVLVLYLGFKKGLFKKLIETSQQQYKTKVQKKQPWER